MGARHSLPYIHGNPVEFIVSDKNDSAKLSSEAQSRRLIPLISWRVGSNLVSRFEMYSSL